MDLFFAVFRQLEKYLGPQPYLGLPQVENVTHPGKQEQMFHLKLLRYFRTVFAGRS
jgi:hypothetical protein